MKQIFCFLALTPILSPIIPLCADIWCDPYAREYIEQCGTYFGSDILYWNGCQRGLTTDLYQTEKESLSLKIKSLDYQWQLGYRLYIGYHDGFDGSDLSLHYTNYQTKASLIRHITDIVEDIELPRHQDFKNNLDYQTLDALVLREYDLGCYSLLRPFAGFRALWIDQSFIKKKSNLDKNGKESTIVAKNYSNLDTIGIGLHAGTEYLLHLCGGFNVNLTVAGSLLQGKIKNLTKVYNNESDLLSPAPLEVTDKYKESQWLSVAGYRLLAGFTWEMTIFDYAWSRFDICYEFNQWFNIPHHNASLPNRFDHITLESTSNSNLMLHGLTFRLMYFF